MPEIAFVNGKFMPLEEAVVPIEDRGYQFADGVYEVIATYNGKPYAMQTHLERLQRSLVEIRIDLDIATYGLQGIVEEGLQRGGFAETLVYIQVTRGVAPRRHDYLEAKLQPTVVMTIKELHRPQSELYETGVRLITAADQRWKRCDIKTIALLPNILAKQAAAEAGAYEALLIDDEGRVTEGSSTSAFCVRDGVIWTSPQGPHILPSITRGIILELARQLEIPLREEFSTLEEFVQADEVFIAGTSTESLPVVYIDDSVINAGAPGPITHRIREKFLETLP